MATIELNGIAMHVRCDGERQRPAVVLSNSLGTDLTMWDAQAAVLAARFYVVRYDTRGHGGSATGTAPCTIDLLGADLLAVLDHVGIECAHVLGLSMGGVIAQWIGAHAPQRVNKLVLANTASRIGTEEGWRSRAESVRRDGLNGIAASAPARWFAPEFVLRQPVIVGQMQKTLRAQSAEGYAACCDALAAADLTVAASTIRAATLVIAGACDPVTTVSDAQALAGAIPGAVLRTLPASHLSNIETPDRFTDAVASFLSA